MVGSGVYYVVWVVDVVIWMDDPWNSLGDLDE